MARRQRESVASLLTSILGTIVFGVLLIAFLPAILAMSTRLAMTPEPSGVNWTPVDASTCLATSQNLRGWPDDKGGLVTRVAVGMSDDVKSARPLAAKAARDFAGRVSALHAPGAEKQLAVLETEFAQAAIAFGEPMTASEFRAEYRKIGRLSLALTTQCHAVGQWVQDHYKQ